jgi:hypothetical protein
MAERRRRVGASGRTNRRTRASRAGPQSEDRSRDRWRGWSPCGRDTARPTLEDLTSDFLDPTKLLDPSHPLGRLSALLLTQLLELQAVLLRSYQRAFQELSLSGSLDDHLRQVARASTSVYLEFVKSIPEHRERLLAMHSPLVKTYLETIEDLQRRLTKSPEERRSTGPSGR